MSFIDIVRILSGLTGISGFESDVASFLKTEFEKYLDNVTIDSLGNVIALKKAVNPCGRIMLEAHMDEIGMLVKKISDNGFLEFVPVGGVDCRILPGSSVIVHSDGNTYKGVIGAKPPHVMTSDEYNETIGFDKLFIDMGFDDYETASKYISIGSSVTFDEGFTELSDGFISSKCMDDRASVAVLLDIAKRISDTDFEYDIYFCICVQEEVGLRGSKVATYSINPDFAIAIDVTHGKTPDESKLDILCGSGFTICKGPNIHTGLVSDFEKYLKSNDISYQLEIEGGNTGTDAWAMQISREGIPVMLLSLPLKYMHTPVETLNVNDCLGLSDALCGYLKSFGNKENILCC